MYVWTFINKKSGVDAVVSKVVDTYYVEVSEQGNTYVITYFTVDSLTLSYTSETEKADLEKVNKNKIQVSIEKVLITYDVD